MLSGRLKSTVSALSNSSVNFLRRSNDCTRADSIACDVEGEVRSTDNPAIEPSNAAREENLFANRLAQEVVSAADHSLATRIGLQAEQSAESSLLDKMIRQATSTSTGHGMSAGTMQISRRTRPPLQIRVSPIRNSPVCSSAVTAIVFITDPLQQPRLTRDALRARFGLTPAECRVALLLGDGYAPRKIANMIGVTDNTVRSQIKSIFSKTGVKRQGDLIRLLLSN
jgi:DNA-binding CsgD family transcriptional regulator